MNKKLFILSAASAVLAMACGTGETETVVEVITDTVTQTQVVEVTVPIDSAAIAAHYDAAHQKAKGTHQVTHKTKKAKKFGWIRILLLSIMTC